MSLVVQSNGASDTVTDVLNIKSPLSVTYNANNEAQITSSGGGGFGKLYTASIGTVTNSTSETDIFTFSVLGTDWLDLEKIDIWSYYQMLQNTGAGASLTWRLYVTGGTTSPSAVTLASFASVASNAATAKRAVALCLVRDGTNVYVQKSSLTNASEFSPGSFVSAASGSSQQFADTFALASGDFSGGTITIRITAQWGTANALATITGKAAKGVKF